MDWFRRYLKLENGIPSRDTFGRVFAAIDAEEFGAAFRCLVSGVVPTLENNEVRAIEGKTSRRSGKVDATPLHLDKAAAAVACARRLFRGESVPLVSKGNQHGIEAR